MNAEEKLRGGQWVIAAAGVLLAVGGQAHASHTCVPSGDMTEMKREVASSNPGNKQFQYCAHVPPAPNGSPVPGLQLFTCACNGTLGCGIGGSSGTRAPPWATGGGAYRCCWVTTNVGTECSGVPDPQGGVVGDLYDQCKDAPNFSCQPGASCPVGPPAAGKCKTGTCSLASEGSFCFPGEGKMYGTELGTECKPLEPSVDACDDALVDEDCNGRSNEDCGPNPEAGCADKTENSVDYASGNVDRQVPLVSVRPHAGPPLELGLTYNSRRGMGLARGWLLSLDAVAKTTADQLIIQLGTGYVMTFNRPTGAAADERSFAPPSDDETVEPRPYPKPEDVGRSLDGTNHGAYLAVIGGSCNSTASCSPLAWISTVAERPNILDSAGFYAVIRSGRSFHQGTGTG